MKKYSLIAAVAALAFASSCTSDFLSVENTGAMQLEEYFTTEEHLAEALVAATTLSSGSTGRMASTIRSISCPTSWLTRSGWAEQTVPTTLTGT